MSDSSIKVPKALQKDALFYGLRAQYINKAIKGVIVVLMGGMVLSIFISGLIAAAISIIGTLVTFSIMLHYSKSHGSNGIEKKRADIMGPTRIRGIVNKKKLLVWEKI